MRSFRIGRVTTPWANLEPPIRGGGKPPVAVQVQRTKVEEDDDDDDSSSESSTWSAQLGSSASSVGDDDDEETKPRPAVPQTRELYTAAQERKEIAACSRAYPSLDPATQQAIRAEYHALHALVEARGYYVCAYSEYAKEAVRYVSLFGMFLFLLRSEWYITSSVFLGMFWVSPSPLSCPSRTNTIIATNHVQRARCGPPRHHWQLCHGHAHRRVRC